MRLKLPSEVPKSGEGQLKKRKEAAEEEISDRSEFYDITLENAIL